MAAGRIKARINRLREKERFVALKRFLLVCALYLSIPLFIIFWFADWLYCPAIAHETLVLRLCVVPACVFVFFAIRKTESLTWVQTVGSIYTLTNSAVIAAIMMMAEGVSSPYYAGLNLVTIGIATFVPWTTPFLLLNLAFIYGPYILGAIFFWDQGRANAFVVNWFFCAGTLIISAVIRYYNERLHVGELVSRVRLQKEVETRDQVIQQKTAEAIRLDSLAKQFSAQVVNAIRKGELDIDHPPQAKRICVVFIDVYESTSAINSIPIQNYQRVIKSFMSGAISILLKHDVTYDKMIGDAVMAFSNDPFEHRDFIQRVANATLEILEKVKKGQEEYAKDWMGPFRIKVGIAAGLADVGFQGGIVRSYTANGPAVNLAARFCSACGPDEILVSPDVAAALTDAGYVVSSVGPRLLKGFGNVESFKLLQASSSIDEWSRFENSRCDACDEDMYLAENELRQWVMICRSCGKVADSKTSSAARGPKAA